MVKARFAGRVLWGGSIDALHLKPTISQAFDWNAGADKALERL